MIVGTAGHIDHGKTSLVQALTGIDADRLKEEKARGITIDLGFAYWPRPDGRVVGFVDVPGHERLVHNMLAGATGIDAVLLVVAADDGVMPQTREHLAIVDLLGLEQGVVALTKTDLVDAARLAAVEAEIRATLAGTALATADILPVSSRTGDGVDRLGACLDALGAAGRRHAAGQRFRLSVDRVFALAGAGTVVTGTVVSGRVAVGDQLTLAPRGIGARVRSLHAQNRPAASGGPGERCAIALVGSGVHTDKIARGDVLLDSALHAPSARLDACLSLLPGERKPLGQWAPVRFHHGAAEVLARVVLLQDAPIAPGAKAFVQLVLERPIAAAAGDRFVLRDISASRTIGGGTLVDLRAPERRRRTPARLQALEALALADPAAALRDYLEGEPGWVDPDAFFRDRALPEARAQAIIEELALVTLSAGTARCALLAATWQRFADQLGQALDACHADKPDLPGLGQERLRLALRPCLPAPLFTSAIRRLAAEGQIVLDRAWLRRPWHEVRLSAEEEQLWARLRPLLGGRQRFRPPRVRDIAREVGVDEAMLRRLFKLAGRRGDVEEVAKDHFFLAATLVEMADIARALAAAGEGGRVGVAEFRDRLDNGRKVAIQILEFFDRQGLTLRRGDIRRINAHKADLFSAVDNPAGAMAANASAEEGGESSPVGRPDFKSGKGRETALGGFDSCLLRQIQQESPP